LSFYWKLCTNQTDHYDTTEIAKCGVKHS
jgi:hypothetical protein